MGNPQKYDESRGSLKAWLSVIARNKAIDRYRQKTKIQTIPLEETVLAQMGVEPEMENREGLQEALAELTEVPAGKFGAYSGHIFSKNGGTFSRAEKAADRLAESCGFGCGDSLFFDGDRLCCGKIFFFKGR